MDRISDSGSDGLGSNPDGSTKKEIKTNVFISFLVPRYLAIVAPLGGLHGPRTSVGRRFNSKH